MDDLFCKIDYRSKSDSIVMSLVRSAMDKAHEKVQSKDGPIEFLHERSKFYELAAILVEGGLKIVEEETDILEDNTDKILSDLMEIRHWLQGRIKDMKHLIIDKDRELIERLENESNLRQTLELKERELIHLHEKLEPGRMKNEGFQEIEDGAPDGDICELKNSVDQQVWNIKQKLEDEHKSLTNETRKITSHVSSPDFSFEVLDEERYENSVAVEKISRIRPLSDASKPDQNILIRWMSSDLDELKETLDLAFGRMQSAEVLPLEKQWRWTIEKDIQSILVKGFIQDLKSSFEDKKGFSNVHRIQERRLPKAGKKMEDKMISFSESLKEERDYLSMQILLMEEANQILLQGFIKDVSTKLCSYDNLEDLPSNFMLPETIRSRLEQDVCMVFFREMVNEWKLERDAYAFENFIREDIYQFVIVDTLKDLHVPLKESEALQKIEYFQDTPRSRKSETEGSLIEKLDFLLECLEAEEDLMLRASTELKEHSVNHDLVILNCEETDERNAIEWLLTDDESTFSSVSKKLERALRQLQTTKELLVELEQSLEISEDLEENDQDMQLSLVEKVDYQFVDWIPSDAVFSPIAQVEQVFTDFEFLVNKNLEMKCQRLEELRHQVDTLLEPVASIRKRKLLYKKAFISRCQNLQLAESEVDLLADQVDTLLHILEKIYFELSQNATVLSRYIGVFDILKLIKPELSNESSCKLKS